jgi:hypothetical protein
MSSTQTTGTGTAFRILRPGEFPVPGILKSGGDPLNPTPTDVPEAKGTERFSDLFRMSGINLSPEESRELRIFDEFLNRHVQPNENCDVQCMLLWSEWVRVFRRNVSGFPDLIREHEFRSAITGTFGVGIATDRWRGSVYAGVRYVP